ncbi:replication protein [Tatumella ptyseos]|uniref:replication protein n=1 Tax=Tatumella ptyseos TaxID=82987 RepID=UPI0023F19F80|nr:replication protein [Tatumella ptyseos]
MNLAYDNVSPIRPELRAVERRVVDTDNGYTKIANELLEAIASADLTARQLKVMMAYIRKTYGFNKKTDRIADEQISQVTGISRQNVNKAKKELISMNCLLMEGNQIGVNKEVSAWKFSKCLQVSNFVSKPETKSVSKLETLPVSNPETHKRHYPKEKKESNKPPKSPKGESPKFDPLSIPVPDFLNSQSWSEWVDYRRQSGKPIKTQVTVTKAFKLLRECYDEGHDPASVIDSSIANGYQGLFKPKGRPSSPPVNQQPEHHWNSPESWEEFI